MKTLFELCVPRADVLAGSSRDSDFAADLAQVINGTAPEEYKDPKVFFSNTYPTQGLKRLLENIALRFKDQGGAASSIFRLDTQYGGGKTHSLIALLHLASGMGGVENVEEFISRDLLPVTPVRVVAFDGENADPINGRLMGGEVRAFTPWGELAYALGGTEGYETIKESDLQGRAPGAENISNLFRGEPVLILLDELAVFLRKAQGKPVANQLTPFLTALFKAIESAPGAALVFTLAIGRTGKAMDAYAEENDQLSLGFEEAEGMEEGQSVAARKATLLDPTAENETASVLKRRLFASIDETGAQEVIEAYKDLWQRHSEVLPVQRNNQDWVEDLTNGFPFHPALISILNDKLSTLNNFQRVRGMLRLLTQTVSDLWNERPSDTYAVHLNHMNPGYAPIRNEIVTRLEFANFDPAIRVDVDGGGSDDATAQIIDNKQFIGQPPYASAVARNIMWHTFAFNEHLKGVNEDELRYNTLAPGMDPSFIDAARTQFQSESAYLDDRPNIPIRFNAEVNLTQIIRRHESRVDLDDSRAQLNDRIKGIFDAKTLQLVPFASSPQDVPDDIGNGKPYLVLISYDAASVGPGSLDVPELVSKIFTSKGNNEEFRSLQNNLVFLVSDERSIEDMRQRMIRRLALESMRSPRELSQLADHQQEKIQEYYQRSEQELAVSIQQCYRHLFFPSRNEAIEGLGLSLGHRALEIQTAAETPGNGETAIRRALMDSEKIKLDGKSTPVSPAYLRDNTPLKSAGEMTTADLRNEFRREPRFPMVMEDEGFQKMVLEGVSRGVFVYKSGDLIFGSGDPEAEIKVGQDSTVYTIERAKELKLWPRILENEPETDGPSGEGDIGTDGKPTGGGVESPSQTESIIQRGPLREALSRAWQDSKSKGWTTISDVEIRIFDPIDAFRLVVAVNQIQGPRKSVSLDASYETSEGGEVHLDFKGSLEECLPVKDFLDPAFRDATEKDLKATFTLEFPEGLSLSGDAPNQITERLARFAAGLSEVEVHG